MHTAHGPGSYDWFSGYGRYMRLGDCMGGDVLWIWLTVGLDLAVAAGYMLIAKHWWENQRAIPDGPAKRALATMKNIFVFCGICGYLFIPIKMVWPAWRLYDIFMAVLVYLTWRYAWGARDLKVVYSELKRTTQLAAELERSQAEARQKSFFLNSISHDLRTPLNGLTLQAQLAEVQLEGQDPAALRETLTEIRAAARATADLLDSFLELGRLDWAHDRASPSTFDLRALFRQVVVTLRAEAERRGLALRMADLPETPVTTDRLKLERILHNLVANAIKFTDRGGVTLGARAQGDTLTIDVEDTGVGIAPADAERIFDEFYQVQNRERDRNKGFGLGLPIARRLARLLGGELVAESRPGLGSRFSVVLPGAAGRDRAEPGAFAGPRQPDGPGPAVAAGRG